MPSLTSPLTGPANLANHPDSAVGSNRVLGLFTLRPKPRPSLQVSTLFTYQAIPLPPTALLYRSIPPPTTPSSGSSQPPPAFARTTPPTPLVGISSCHQWVIIVVVGQTKGINTTTALGRIGLIFRSSGQNWLAIAACSARRGDVTRTLWRATLAKCGCSINKFRKPADRILCRFLLSFTQCNLSKSYIPYNFNIAKRLPTVSAKLLNQPQTY